MKVVFMGTPEFAATILEKLIKNNIEIVGVVTVADKPTGRGLQLSESAVKKLAIQHNLTLLQPLKLKDPDFIFSLENLKADLFVVVAFRMLPEIVWQMPSKGCFNLHGSLLPQYRGAAPINWAIINGEKKTGVTTFFIEKEIDTGKIIDQEEIEIGENENVGSVYERLMHLGASLTLKTVKQLEVGNVIAKAQDEFISETLKHAPKLFKETGWLDLNSTLKDFHNRTRGLSPYPCAWIKLKHKVNGLEKTLKIFETSIQLNETKNNWVLNLIDGKIELVEIQLEGKKRMKTEDFLRGFQHNDWEIVAKNDSF
jgi:methionyl-tRNA formyltransferase